MSAPGPLGAVDGGAPPPLPDTGIGPVPEPGRLDRLAPGLARLTAPNPGVMTGPGTNTYLVGAGEMAVVDPGPDDPQHLSGVEAAAASLGGTIRWVLVTHTHPDHAPGAAALAARTGAEVVGFGPNDGFMPDRAVGEGWTLEAPSFRLTALHTPGHASDHLCWLLAGPQILLSGDHVMDRVTVVIAPPDGNMSDYMASLRRLLAVDPPLEAIAPGHGRLLGRPATVVTAVLAHRQAREERVAAALVQSGEATLDELVGRVYADVDPGLHAIARASLWAHLEKLVEDGRALEVAGAPAPAYRAVGAPTEQPG
jgi:glyoxylase-like metal-dependent hydrolase (beta-lactamase superfamily II)